MLLLLLCVFPVFDGPRHCFRPPIEARFLRGEDHGLLEPVPQARIVGGAPNAAAVHILLPPHEARPSSDGRGGAEGHNRGPFRGPALLLRQRLNGASGVRVDSLHVEPPRGEAGLDVSTRELTRGIDHQRRLRSALLQDGLANREGKFRRQDFPSGLGRLELHECLQAWNVSEHLGGAPADGGHFEAGGGAARLDPAMGEDGRRLWRRRDEPRLPRRARDSPCEASQEVRDLPYARAVPRVLHEGKLERLDARPLE
mmetsp:Transcript_17106/g.34977  ORF Transcript_17106/g.34977 Transcript_17106/m.34977 type:complete len:256 (+) Transcript_17106:89-856(+)